MKIRLKYGDGYVVSHIPASNFLGCLSPKHRAGSLDPSEEIRRALENPIRSPRLSKMVGTGDNVVILASDVTRPAPTHLMIPQIMRELARVKPVEDKTAVIFATGLHRKQTFEEKASLVGAEMIDHLKLVDHDPDDNGGLAHIGRTGRGTDVEISRLVADADLVVATGNIDAHWFAGCTGGGKAILPGVSGRETTRQNHSLMSHPKAKAGALDDNPVRMDIEEGAGMLDQAFILNTVLNDEKQVVCAVAGDPVQAHREGAKFCGEMYEIPFDRKASIVVASAGGFPNDINLYQAQKSLENTVRATRDHGAIILVSECREGFGDGTFRRWMHGAERPEDIMQRFGQGFVMGGHKAYAFARVLKRFKVILVSSMKKDMVRKALLTPASSLDEALHMAFEIVGMDSEILVMPHAASMIPKPTERHNGSVARK